MRVAVTIRCVLRGLLLVAAAARPAAARETPEGSIVYVVDGAVYLDRGTKNGLARGTLLSVTRANIPVAELRVIDAADHTAIAAVLAASSLPRVRDRFALPAANAMQEPAQVTAPGYPAPVSIAEHDLAAAWRSSLAAYPPKLLRYDKPRHTALTSRGYAATRFEARSASGVPAAHRQEQLTYLRSRVDNLGLTGLSMHTRGLVDLRFDENPDRYLPGQTAVPLVHELGLHYQTREPGFSAAAGRFRPLARFAGTVDGAEISAAGKTVTLTGYGGFKPSLQRLTPENNPVAGAAVILGRQDVASPWSVTTGYMREYAHTTLSRQTVAIDSEATYRDRVFVAQSAMVDLPQVTEHDGVSLAEFNVHAAAPVSARTTVSTGLRYDRGRIYPLEAGQYPQDWLPYSQTRSQTRVDADARVELNRFGTVRPYAFWLRESSRLEPFVRITALGLAYRLENILGRQVALDVDGDVGHGTREQADVQLTLSSTGDGWFGWSAGQANHWTYSETVGIHTFMSLIRLGTFAHLAEGLRLTVSGQSTLGMALASTPSPAPTYHRGDAGVEYVW